jgi:hypothetical protein
MPLLSRDVKLDFIFIVKPPARARGEGISLFSKSIPQFLIDAKVQKSVKHADNCTKSARMETTSDGENSGECDDEEEYIIQRYLANPLLVHGFKVDLRIYVVCTSFDPLRLYVYNEGLVRFTTEPYPPPASIHESLSNVFCHLTNYSINKHSANYKKASATEEGDGSKWTLNALKKYFVEHGMPWESAWKDIIDVIVKTFLAVEGSVCAKTSVIAGRHSCFELYGFDVMLDRALKAHLIEVNVMPSLACAAALDKHVKGHLIADTLTLAGIPFVDKVALEGEDRASREEQRAGLALSSGSEEPALLQANMPSRPTKFDSKKWQGGPFGYFSNHITEQDKQMLRDCEEELKRRGAFQRIFPTLTSSGEYEACIQNRRHFNYLLASWEVVKDRTPAEKRRSLVQWLAGDEALPLEPGPKKKPRVIAPPRCAVIASSRVSVEPKPPKPAAFPPIEKRSIPVCMFQFVPVPGK